MSIIILTNIYTLLSIINSIIVIIYNIISYFNSIIPYNKVKKLIKFTSQIYTTWSYYFIKCLF